MGESINIARNLVRGLITAGVRDVVLCPGSRSAPLAYAVAEAEAVGGIRLHVRTDERTAGFLALGLGCGDPSRPAVVITTSGTAVANLHPAVLEAFHARVPLILLTADRPAHLHGTWANQTTQHQATMFGEAVVHETDPRRAVAASLGLHETPPGPVHMNLGLDEPLYLEGEVCRDYPATGAAPEPTALPTVEIPFGPRTVVVAGDRAGAVARALAEVAGWPLFAEPSSNSLPSSVAVAGYRMLDLSGVERAVVVGRPTLSRPIMRLLNHPDVEVIHVVRHSADPGPGRDYIQLVGTPTAVGNPSAADQEWLQQWLDRGTRAERVMTQEISRRGPSGPRTAAELVDAVKPGEAVMIASSNAVRDMDLVAHRLPPHVLVVANRGLAGIDGTISTAMGVALASGRSTQLLVGDLAFLHDLNALNLPPGEPRPDLRIIVVNDSGGAIFSSLEYGARPDFFERVFGTPHQVHLSKAAAAHGFPITEVLASRNAVRAFLARLTAEVAHGTGTTSGDEGSNDLNASHQDDGSTEE